MKTTLEILKEVKGERIARAKRLNNGEMPTLLEMKAYADEEQRRIQLRLENDPALKELIHSSAHALAETIAKMNPPKEALESLILKAFTLETIIWEDVNERFKKQFQTNA